MDVAPEPIVYSRVGELYGQIREAFETLPDLFIGPEINQDTDDWAPDLKVRLVRDRQSASEAINNIVIEGEGTPEKREGSHYARFQQVRQALAERPDFEAARPVVTNPLTRMHRDVNSDSSVTLILHPDSEAVAEVFSQVYQTALMPSVLICLFEGVVQTVDVHLRPDTLHCGVQRGDDKLARWLAKFRKRGWRRSSWMRNFFP